MTTHDDGSVSAGLCGIVCGGSNVPVDYDRIELRIPKGTVHRFRMNTTVTLLTDGPALFAEVERLRAALDAVRALVSDTDGNWLGPDDFDGLAGCIQEVVCDPALGVQS